MLKSVLKARQHSILHPERIVGKPEGILLKPVALGWPANFTQGRYRDQWIALTHAVKNYCDRPRCTLLQARTLLAAADRPFGSIAANVEPFLP